MQPPKGEYKVSKKNPKNDKFYEIITALTEIDEQIEDIKKEIAEMNKHGSSVNEVCPDELYANKAVLETVKNLCINALMEGNSKGEA